MSVDNHRLINGDKQIKGMLLGLSRKQYGTVKEIRVIGRRKGRFYCL